MPSAVERYFQHYPERARAVWLRAHGVVYHPTKRASLASLLRPAADVVDIEELPLQWVARLEITPPA